MRCARHERRNRFTVAASEAASALDSLGTVLVVAPGTVVELSGVEDAVGDLNDTVTDSSAVNGPSTNSRSPPGVAATTPGSASGIASPALVDVETIAAKGPLVASSAIGAGAPDQGSAEASGLALGVGRTVVVVVVVEVVEVVVVVVVGLEPPPLGAAVVVVVGELIANERVTSAAVAQSPSPAWLAVIEQVPAVRIVAVVPDTVHTDAVVEVRVTDRPEVADAVSATEAVAVVVSEGWVNEIVWFAVAKVRIVVIRLLMLGPLWLPATAIPLACEEFRGFPLAVDAAFGEAPLSLPQQ